MSESFDEVLRDARTTGNLFLGGSSFAMSCDHFRRGLYPGFLAHFVDRARYWRAQPDDREEIDRIRREVGVELVFAKRIYQCVRRERLARPLL